MVTCRLMAVVLLELISMLTEAHCGFSSSHQQSEEHQLSPWAFIRGRPVPRSVDNTLSEMNSYQNGLTDEPNTGDLFPDDLEYIDDEDVVMGEDGTIYLIRDSKSNSRPAGPVYHVVSPADDGSVDREEEEEFDRVLVKRQIHHPLFTSGVGGLQRRVIHLQPLSSNQFQMLVPVQKRIMSPSINSWFLVKQQHPLKPILIHQPDGRASLYLPQEQQQQQQQQQQQRLFRLFVLQPQSPQQQQQQLMMQQSQIVPEVIKAPDQSNQTDLSTNRTEDDSHNKRQADQMIDIPETLMDQQLWTEQEETTTDATSTYSTSESSIITTNSIIEEIITTNSDPIIDVKFSNEEEEEKEQFYHPHFPSPFLRETDNIPEEEEEEEKEIEHHHPHFPSLLQTGSPRRPSFVISAQMYQ